MKIIIVTKGNPECDPDMILQEIVECDYFQIENQEENGLWLKCYHNPRTPNQLFTYHEYDPEIDVITVIP